MTDDEPDEPMIDWDAVSLSDAMPPLLGALPRPSDALARTLTAAQLADLGSAFHAEPPASRAYYVERWRRGVLQGAPGSIPMVGNVAAAKVGEIVHDAVRGELPSDDETLLELLQRFAWEEGIVDTEQNRRAVEDAFDLLDLIRRSDVFEWIARARAVYRQVPFVYQTDGGRTIDGVIDLLIQDEAGQWRIVDYKTNWLGKGAKPHLRAHARRYHLQMGVYAAAVQKLVGFAPIGYIHYIRYVQTVIIDERDWKAALDQLEDYIAALTE